MDGRSESLEAYKELLDTRGIDLCKYNITPQTEAWLQQHVSASTLLTKEELSFSQRVQSSPSQTSAPGSSIQDEAYEAAIRSLHTSITNIEQQCSILESHKKALLELRKKNTRSAQEALARHTLQKLTKDRAQLDVDIEHVTTTVRTDLETELVKIDSKIKLASDSATEALDDDNRALDGLQKVLPKLRAQDDDLSTTEAIERLCKQWISYERQATRTKIDHTYDQALRKAMAAMNGTSNGDVGAEAKAVRAELAELSSEIDGLIALIAEHHYRGRLLQALKQARKDNEAETARWSEYIACVLLYLTARLEALHELHQHSHIYKSVVKTLETELSNTADNTSTADIKTSPIRDIRHDGRGLRPLRLVQANHNDSQDGTAQMLKLLNIRPTINMDPFPLSGLMARLLHERLLASSAREAALSQQHNQVIAKSLQSSNEHVRALYDALLSNTDTNGIKLLPNDVEESIDLLQAKTDELASEMQNLDIDEIARRFKSVI